MKPIAEASASLILVVIGVVLIFVSSVVPKIVLREQPPPSRSLDLWNLGWGFVLAGVLLVK